MAMYDSQCCHGFVRNLTSVFDINIRIRVLTFCPKIVFLCPCPTVTGLLTSFSIKMYNTRDDNSCSETLVPDCIKSGLFIFMRQLHELFNTEDAHTV